MIIKRLLATEDGVTSVRLFNKGKILVTSKNNSKGKTTLLRLLLYALGFQIPSLSGICFDEIYFEVEIEAFDKTYIINRHGPSFDVKYEQQEMHYVLPSDHVAFLMHIFNCSNINIIENLLGVFYIDQDKGWSLLNRGSVVGKVKFNIERLCAGLNDKNIDDLLSKLDLLEKEKNKYLLIQNLQQAIDSAYIEQGELEIPEKIDEYKNKILYLKIQRNDIKSQISDIQSLINKQQELGDYINSLKLRVKVNDQNEIPVTTDNILNFDDCTQINKARIHLLSYELDKINRSIKEYEALIQQEKDKTATDLFETIDEKDRRLLENVGKFVYSSQADVSDLLDSVQRELKEQRNKIKTAVKTDNQYIAKIYNYVLRYAKELGVSSYIGNGEKFIFTSDLKSLSGSILSKIIFCFKLAFMKIIEEKTNIRLPFIVDSPGSKELDKMNMKKIYALMNKELQNNQVFVASIHRYGQFDQTIVLDGLAIE